MNCFKLPSYLAVAMLFFTCFTVAFAQDAFEDARKKVEQSSEEEAAMRAALASNDLQTADGHRREAHRLLIEARNLYEEAGAADTNDSDLLDQYARLLGRTNDPDLEVVVLRQLSSFVPEDAEVWARLGSALSRLGDSKIIDAKNAYEQALSLEAEAIVHAQAYAGLGRLYYDLGLYQLAEETFVKVLPLNPKDIETIIALAALHLRRGSVIVAADTLDGMGAALGPHGVLLQEYLAKALADFDLNRVWFPDTASFHLAYAKLTYRAGRLLEAVDILDRSLELNDKNHVSWNLLGSFRNQAGDIDGARAALTRSLALNPNQPRTQQILKTLGTSSQ